MPLLALVLRCFAPTPAYPSVALILGHVWAVITDPRSLASYRLSFGMAFGAALINGAFGLVAAWALTRYRFFGRRIADALVDLPFAMPTSIAGLALTQLVARNGGYLGRLFNPHIAYTPWGVLVALIFVGFPFVVRTLQPVIADLVIEAEEAAACLGANRWQTLRRVVLPALRPALITGIMLAFGRGVGEYGSVVFISGNIPGLSEITPQLIIMKLENFDYAGAAGLGVVMLAASVLIITSANVVQHASTRRRTGP
jgi:sulfate transport system permease protein